MMKKITTILAALFLCLQLSAQQENARPILGTFVFNGQQPELVPKASQPGQLLLRRSSVPAAEEHQHTGDCCGQQPTAGTPEICGTVSYNKQLRERYPSMSSDEEFEAFLATASKKPLRQSAMKRSADGEKVYKIPIIIHVIFYSGQAIGQDHNLTDAAIYSQIAVLNEDYRKKVNTRGYNNFDVGADTHIEFVPAVYDPQGNKLAKPGIHRIMAESITDGVNVLDSAQRFISTATGEWIKAQTSWEPNCYMNIWSMGLGGGVLGIGTFPDVNLPGIAGYDLTPPAAQDGIMVDYRRFGAYEKGPFPAIAQNAYGRTLTHEVGHFLGLRHTFGDAPTDGYGQRPEGCRYDDYVDDTPNSKIPMYDQFSPLYLCGEREMIENYMDYSPEQVMCTFTKGQVTRMHTVLENSPRRKQLTTSAVADSMGKKISIVDILASSTSMSVQDIFSFEASVEQFPGTYTWTFEGGVPATSTSRSAGVYFTTPGQKKVTLTVSNRFGSISKNIWVTVNAPEACKAVYATTLSTLPLFSSRAIDPGSFATGHGNVFGINFIANRFETDTAANRKGITQVEMKLHNFYTQNGYDPETRFKVYIMSEKYDSAVISKSTAYVTNGYKLYKPDGTINVQYSLSYNERDTLIKAYKASADVAYNIDDSDPNWFNCRKRSPGDTLAVQYVKVSDLENAFSKDRALLVKFDQPVVPTTDHYYIAINLDYDYYAATRRQYSFELLAGFSPTNFSWANGPITKNNAATDPTVTPYILEWKPFNMEAFANSWGAPVLMHLLPVYTSDSTAFAAPDFTLSASTVAPGQSVTFTHVGSKPAGVTNLKWTIEKENGTLLVVNDEETSSYTYTEPGIYNVSLSYIGSPCLQKTVKKKVVVKGIRFTLSSDQNGYPIYCATKLVNLKINEQYKSGSSVIYTWHGNAIEGDIGTVGANKAVTPGATRTYSVTAVDAGDPTITATESITVTLNTADPTAEFEVLTPHLRRGDTLDIYVAGTQEYLEIKNKSTNLSHQITSGRVQLDSRWYVESPTAALFSGAANVSYNFRTLIAGGVANNGPGMYRLALRTCNRLCASFPFVAGTKQDTAIVYLNFMGQQSFGPLEFTANGKPISITAPPAYPNARGSYNTYVALGGNIDLEAVSPEITGIQWTNGYTHQSQTTKKISLTNVRDITSFTVVVTRQRSNGVSTITYPETVTVVVYPDTYKPTQKAVARFTPSADSICLGTKVRFSNLSTNAVDFKWEFSGGVSAQDAKNWDLNNLWHPTQQFNTAGSYQVKLTVTSFDGTTDSYTRTITAIPATNPKLLFAVSGNIPAALVNDTIYALGSGGFTLSVSGLGISKIKQCRMETFRAMSSTWGWSNVVPKGMDLPLTFHLLGQNPLDPNRYQQVEIIGLACDGVTEVKKVFPAKLIPILNMDYFTYNINGVPQQLTDKSLLVEQSICPGEPLNLEWLCNNADLKKNLTVTWYEVSDSGVETVMATGFTYTAHPIKNTQYKVSVISKVGQGVSYIVPVKIGVAQSQLRLMNTDLQMTGDTLVVPAGYTSDLVIRVNELVNPAWKKAGSPTVLSNTNTLVVTTPKDTAKYQVGAASLSGGCQYALTFTIIKLSAKPDEDDTDDTTNGSNVIEMYPIPARDVLNIEVPYNGDAYIVSGNGQLVKQLKLTTGKTSISVSGMAAGVYRFVVQQAKTGKIVSRNFVVTH